MVTKQIRFTMLLSAFLLTGCPEPGSQPQNSDSGIPAGVWRAVVEVPGGELPFQIEFQQSRERGWRAFYVNGEERVRVLSVSVNDDGVDLFMPAFNSHIAASLQDGALVGTLTVIKTGAEPHVMPFRAEHDQHYRFHEMLKPPQIDVSGRWEVSFTDDDGKETPAVGIFEQRGAEVTGTFLTPAGDYRYLAGEVAGRELLLSTFDGSHVFLFKAIMDERDELHGDFWSALKWHESWHARRNAAAKLPDADSLTFLKPGFERFTFSFPDETGKPVSLDDPRFENKVIVVTLAGSWCPNCHDEAAFMAPWYLENRERGVEVVALMFEHFGDFETAARQTREFRKKFGIEYTTLIAGVSDKQQASETLPMLNAVMAFPTTLFIDANGAVRRIHTGFSGPGTGERYERLLQDFNEFVAMLVSERDQGK